MYIWRSKNRRDRRHLRLSGAAAWGPPRGETSTEVADDLLRHEGEAVHVGYFHDRIRVVMHKYLNSSNGKDEVGLLVGALDEAARRLAIAQAEAEAEAEAAARTASKGKPRRALDHSKLVVVPAEMTKRKNIYEIYRKFDADGSGGIDQNELKVLLDELKIPMTPEELEAVFAELDEDGGGEIEFEEFYNWFVREADKQRQKQPAGLLGLLRSAVQSDVFDGFKRLVLEVEARNLAMDQAVYRAAEDARREYRVAHPPRYVCPDAHCSQAFPTKKLLDLHVAALAEHAEADRAREQLLQSFRVMEEVLAGPVGRNILANRLLFSVELGSMQTRVDAARETPFRCALP